MEESAKDTLLFANLRKVINLVDELRDIGVQQYINLPRIAVLGTQSSGKSSLLESIMGLDFLPRGEVVFMYIILYNMLSIGCCYKKTIRIETCSSSSRQVSVILWIIELVI